MMMSSEFWQSIYYLYIFFQLKLLGHNEGNYALKRAWWDNEKIRIRQAFNFSLFNSVKISTVALIRKDLHFGFFINHPKSSYSILNYPRNQNSFPTPMASEVVFQTFSRNISR